jgi:hypothetical protein
MRGLPTFFDPLPEGVCVMPITEIIGEPLKHFECELPS